jgi:soluble cytochrome b562
VEFLRIRNFCASKENIKKVKGGCGMAQVVRQLPSSHKALCSNSSTTKTKRREKERSEKAGKGWKGGLNMVAVLHMHV